jgi:hypothetical protein
MPIASVSIRAFGPNPKRLVQFRWLRRGWYARCNGARERLIPPEIGVLPALLLLIAACSRIPHPGIGVGGVGRPAIHFTVRLRVSVRILAVRRWFGDWISLAGATCSRSQVISHRDYCRPAFNQSGAHFPYLAGLLGMTIYLDTRNVPGGAHLGATVRFAVLDAADGGSRSVCDLSDRNALRLHLLNAIVLFWLSNTLSREATRGC